MTHRREKDAVRAVTPHIRPYAAGDEDPAVSVWSAAAILGHPFLDEEGTGERERMLRQVYLVQAENWVALDELGKVVGLLGLLDHDDAPWEVGGLFVHPDAQGGGYGRALLDHAAKLKGTLTLEVFERNRNARAFYAHMGFVETGQRVDDSTGFVLCLMARAELKSNKPLRHRST